MIVTEKWVGGLDAAMACRSFGRTAPRCQRVIAVGREGYRRVRAASGRGIDEMAHGTAVMGAEGIARFFGKSAHIRRLSSATESIDQPAARRADPG